MSKKLSDYEVLTFDCYGTLIDWETGIWDAFQPLIMKNKRNDLDRQTVLQRFAQAESARQERHPGMIYSGILEAVHQAVADELIMETSAEMNRQFGDSVPKWPAFADSADALRLLKQHFKLAILSNISNADFAASNEKLGVEFDAVYTAEDIGSYKPNPENFRYMLSHLQSDLGLEKEGVLHTAQSLFHDHVQAKNFGLDCAWIDRQGLSQSDNWGATAVVKPRPEVDFIFASMAELTSVL